LLKQNVYAKILKIKNKQVLLLENLKGIVERITYSDEEKGFSVIKIKSKGYTDLIVLVGNMASVNIGSVVSVQGTWSMNPKFGRQFNVSSWEETLPASVYGIEKYLGSGLIRGIGPKFAKAIVEKFGSNTLEIIENQVSKLTIVPNIGNKRVAMISKAWQEQKEIKDLMIFLQEHSVSTAFGYRIYKAYGKQSIEKVKSNPYALADDIHGIGFKTADMIATKLGLDRKSYNRCRVGVFYVLNYFADNEGHCYVPVDEMIKKCVEMLEVEDCKIVMTYDHLVKTQELILEDKDKLYLPPFYYSEIGLAKRIKNILSTEPEHKITNICELINNLEISNKIKYDEIQREAIELAVNSKFCVITGGPGVGKTTILKAIIDIFRIKNMRILLSATTGRAAKRMSETTKLEAKTIHRLLDSSPNGYKKNSENSLESDVLILDETSMIDLILMYNLTKAIPDNMRVILIGDSNQLPSVGAGNVLGDIIESGDVPVVKLTQIYRQAQKSKIVINSHKINFGEMPYLACNKDSDFFFIEEEGQEKIVNLISDLCSRRLPNKLNVNPMKDIQVLTPMRRGETGTENLNFVLQKSLNKSDLLLRRGAIEFRENDKVMQIKNNYEKEVFNGDIGFVSKVDVINKNLIVNFDERKIEYDILELDELVLSYAISIHKSHGAEFPIVIMPFKFKHYVMLQRNLLYTGITRARKMVILAGEKKAVKYAVGNDKAKKRYVGFCERIKKICLSSC